LYNVGETTINTCTISGNTCGHGGKGGWSGDIFNGYISASGFGGNGGAIFNGGMLALTSCTISWNAAGKGGAGVDGVAFVHGSNIVNAIGIGTGGGGGNGGGIFDSAAAAAPMLRNTLVASNLPGAGGDGGIAIPDEPTLDPPPSGPAGPDGKGRNLDGVFVSQGFNLIGIVDRSVGLTNGASADLVGTATVPIDPLLGPLQNNGGHTLTHALLPGSPAIDKGRRFHLTADQRGHHRPHDFASIPNAPGGDGTDIGAFELDVPILAMKKFANGTVLSWDLSCSGYTLEATTNLDLSGWSPVLGASCIAGCEYQATDNVKTACKFLKI
jgi:hypothetical protein